MVRQYLSMAEVAAELAVSRQRVFVLVKGDPKRSIEPQLKDAGISNVPMISRKELDRFKKTRNGNGRPKGKPKKPAKP